MKSKICLIRHGITRGNRDRLYYGQSDIPLIEDGEKEISRLAKEGIYPDSEDAVYYTTGLQRTEQTFGLIYGDKPHDRIELLQEIRQNYADFVLRDFARRKHVSSAYLCKVLKEATGKNCTALLQERRIEKAKRMLRETDLSVMEGLRCFAACLPMALGGLLSAIAQGRVAASSINILAKKPSDWSKGLVLCGIVEFYAILSLLASMLMLYFLFLA